MAATASIWAGVRSARTEEQHSVRASAGRGIYVGSRGLEVAERSLQCPASCFASRPCSKSCSMCCRRCCRLTCRHQARALRHMP